jgi:hypothetical protein
MQLQECNAVDAGLCEKQKMVDACSGFVRLMNLSTIEDQVINVVKKHQNTGRKRPG